MNPQKMQLQFKESAWIKIYSPEFQSENKLYRFRGIGSEEKKANSIINAVSQGKFLA